MKAPDRLRGHALFAAGAALALAAGGAVLDPARLVPAYVAAVLSASCVPLGALLLWIIVALVPSEWGPAMLPILGRACAALPLVGLLLVPALLLIGHIYPWVREAAPLPAFKAAYLTPWFFVARTVLFVAACIGLAAVLRPADRAHPQPLAAIGAILFPVLSSLFAVDWLLSADPEAHSSIFGLWVVSIQFLAGTAWMAAGLPSLADPPVRRVGALLVTGLLLWGYATAMQYVIVWAGNVPDEVAWYLRRADPVWLAAIVLVIAVRGGALLALFSERLRRDPAVLRRLSLAILATVPVEIAWILLPADREAGAAGLVTAVALAVAIGGLLLAAARQSASPPHRPERAGPEPGVRG